MVEDGTYGVGIVLLTKVLCVMKPDRFIALLPYASGNGKGKQDIGRVVFGLTMPSLDSTGLSIGRLAYWSNDLLSLDAPLSIDVVGRVCGQMPCAAGTLGLAKGPRGPSERASAGCEHRTS